MSEPINTATVPLRVVREFLRLPANAPVEQVLERAAAMRNIANAARIARRDARNKFAKKRKPPFYFLRVYFVALQYDRQRSKEDSDV